MTRCIDTVWCSSCGVEILWAPIDADRRNYCCEACLAGARCQCGELGSVSRKLVHHAGCSVLVVKEKAAEQG